MNVKLNFNKKSTEIYCSFDPAIDLNASDIVKYMETRDSSFLKFKPDQTPTKFFLKNIPRGIFVNGIMANESPYIQVLLAFQYGVEKIENLKETFLNEDVEIVNDGINVWEPSEVITLNDGNKLKYIDKDVLEKCFNLQTVMEIGTIALKKTNYVPGTKLTYPVLPTSIAIIDTMKS